MLGKFKKLSLKTQLPVLAGVVMVFGLFAVVMGTQQRQDTRSRAASTTCAQTLGDLEVDNCTLDGNVSGNLKGSNNTISNNVGGFVVGDNNKIGNNAGSIQGNGNRVGNNVAYCVKGNYNTILNNVGGTVVGIGNTARQVANYFACQPNPYATPTPTRIPTTVPTSVPTTVPTSVPTTVPTRAPATCADGIDNNQNELIDGGDPVCHTDGNQNNPNSYDPTRNETGTRPTTAPTPTTRPSARCSDQIDNDSNGFKDNLDSTCHTDNNPRNPNSYDPNRDGERGGLNTCADSRDNNNNGTIDGGDPICHWDGNPNNPDSYDPERPESGPTVTVTVPPTTSPTTPPTIPPGNTSIGLNLLLHGLGKGGDSANPNSGGNPDPIRKQRSVAVEIYNSQNVLLLSKEGVVNFNATAGNFTGTVNLGTTVPTGIYTVRVKSTQFLRTLVPGIQNLIAGTTNQLPTTVMVNGDIDGNNSLNILDYNTLLGCYSDFQPAPSCTAANKLLSDLDDDGNVNQFDYNLFLRELTNRQGQ